MRGPLSLTILLFGVQCAEFGRKEGDEVRLQAAITAAVRRTGHGDRKQQGEEQEEAEGGEGGEDREEEGGENREEEKEEKENEEEEEEDLEHEEQADRERERQEREDREREDREREDREREDRDEEEKSGEGAEEEEDDYYGEHGEYKCEDSANSSTALKTISRALWHDYVKKLYRHNTISDLPRITEVDMIYVTNPSPKVDPDPQRRIGVRLPWKASDIVVEPLCCASDNVSPYRDYNVHGVIDAVWFRRSKKIVPFPAIANHTWVEVTHCGGSKFETEGAWFYIVKGSALYVNTGKTIVFARHSDAAKRFLKRPCREVECDDEIPEFTKAAGEEGFDSLQFTSHCDCRCNFCGHEMVLTKTDGSYACPPNVEFRTGPNGSKRCVCDPDTQRRSERGFCAACAVGH